MPDMIFSPDMRVSARRSLKPCRDKESAQVKRFAKGTVVYVDAHFVWVVFDGMDHEIRVRPYDLLPITLDELFAIEPEHWDVIRPSGSGTDAA